MAAGSSASSKVVLVACLLALCHGTYGGELYGKNTEEEGCIVLHNASFLTPRSVHILSYIAPKQPMSIELTYNGRDKNTYKEVVELSNTEATHRVWEKGSYTAARHLFPINIPKGWNTLTLTAAKEDIALTYLNREDKEVREHRQLHSTIKTINLEGNFSLCSGASPEWLVSDSSEVAVTLDYQSETRQLLEVTGDGNASTFLKLSEGEKYVPANTTLAMSTTQQASGYTVEVREGDKYLGHYSSSEPAVVMGSRQGNSHLRLKRETSSTPPSPTTESTDGLVINVNYYCSHNSPDESMNQESVNADAPSGATEGREDNPCRKLIFTESKVLPPKNEIGEAARRENIDAEIPSGVTEGREDDLYRKLIFADSPPKNVSRVSSTETTVDLTSPSPAEETKDDKQPSKEEKLLPNPSPTAKILPPSQMKKKRVVTI